jgi:hypothetical protein
MEKFVVGLLQLGASTPRERYNSIVDMKSRFWGFTDKDLAMHIKRQADISFHSALVNLQSDRFVNLIVDAGTVLQIKTIPCLLTNPFCTDPPVLLDLKENTNFDKVNYSELFTELIVKIHSAKLILSAVVIDNLRAQSAGLDSALAEIPVPIIHVRCFAHMANLILSDTRKTKGGNFNLVFDILSEIQKELRSDSFKFIAGKRCPRFIETRWLYMVDSLTFILQHRVQVRRFLASGDNESNFRDIPLELFQLYAILAPFRCFVNAVESRQCSLAYIVPLARGLLNALRNVREILRTDLARTILRDMCIRLQVRLSVNNVVEAIAAYSLTPAGRAELRESEKGYCTKNPESDIGIPEYEAHLDLKTHLKNDDYDDTFNVLKQEITRSVPFFADHVESDFTKDKLSRGKNTGAGSTGNPAAVYAAMPLCQTMSC